MGERAGLVSSDLKGIKPKRLKRILQELTKRGAFLFAFKDMSASAIFMTGSLTPIIALTPDEMWALVTSGVVDSFRPGRESLRYRLAPEGRAVLARLSGASAPPSEASAFAAAQGEKTSRTFRKGETATRRTVNAKESPLTWLARRKNAKGESLLAPHHLKAGEKLRADFERSQLSPQVTQNWNAFLASVDTGRGRGDRDISETASAARKRVQDALSHLGPDLSDAAFRICCFCTGVETVEREQGWSARSGKVVLRIALERLAAFYGLLPPLHDNVARAIEAAPVPACAARDRAARGSTPVQPVPSVAC